MPSTALTVADLVLEDPGPDREIDLEVLDLDDVRPVVRRSGGGPRAAGAARHRDPPAGSVAQQRARWPVVAARGQLGLVLAADVPGIHGSAG